MPLKPTDAVSLDENNIYSTEGEKGQMHTDRVSLGTGSIGLDQWF